MTDRTTRPPSPRTPAKVNLPRGPQVEFKTVGHSVQNRPIDCLIFGNGHDVVLILATIHGNEYAGTPLVTRLVQKLKSNPGLAAGKQVILMPVANPDGYARRTRHNVHGVDLNRNFPAGNFRSTNRHGSSPLSEPESKAIFDVLQAHHPRRIVSIHQPLRCIDYDGPGGALASAMGRWTDLPIKRLGSRPGSLGSYAGLTLGIPIITLELPEAASDWSPDRLWNEYGEALLAAIRFPE